MIIYPSFHSRRTQCISSFISDVSWPINTYYCHSPDLFLIQFEYVYGKRIQHFNLEGVNFSSIFGNIFSNYSLAKRAKVHQNLSSLSSLRVDAGSPP